MNLVKLYQFHINKVLCSLNIIKWLNDFLAIFALIMLHIYRLGHTGKVCSGDYNIDNSDKERYLLLRGKLMFIHMVI